MKIVTTQQMKAMEAASLEHGMTYLQLMDNAGKAAAEFIRNLIRESKSHQIETIIGMSAGEGMVTMDNSLFALYQAGRITAETAVAHSLHPDLMEKRLRQAKGR